MLLGQNIITSGLNKRLMSEHVLRLRLDTVCLVSVCVGLCSFACNCVHLLASACVCVHLCVSAFACLQPRAFHHKVELIDSIYLGKLPSENWVPPKESLLGLGQPWEPDPWECDDEAEECVLVRSCITAYQRVGNKTAFQRRLR